MADTKSMKKGTPRPAFLVVQEVAWALGMTAMLINAANHGPDWIWIAVLTLWQATIIWGYIKLRRATAS
jgi:hypothetical protein